MFGHRDTEPSELLRQVWMGSGCPLEKARVLEKCRDCECSQRDVGLALRGYGGPVFQFRPDLRQDSESGPTPVVVGNVRVEEGIAVIERAWVGLCSEEISVVGVQGHPLERRDSVACRFILMVGVVPLPDFSTGIGVTI